MALAGGVEAVGPVGPPSAGVVNSTRTRPAGLDSIVGGFLDTVVTTVATTVQPEAAAAVASTFTFPLLLMLLVLVYLVVESRVDARDPKLRAAPLTSADNRVTFADEDAL